MMHQVVERGTIERGDAAKSSQLTVDVIGDVPSFEQ